MHTKYNLNQIKKVLKQFKKGKSPIRQRRGDGGSRAFSFSLFSSFRQPWRTCPCLTFSQKKG